MAGTYIIELGEAARTNLKDGVDTLVVYAHNAADATALVKAAVGGGAGDAAWALITPTLGAVGTDLTGWRLRIKVGDLVDVTATGAAGATVNSIGDLAVIALNATSLIAGAAYATPNLTIAETTDGLGDEKVTAYFLPPLLSSDFGDPRVSVPTFLSTITDEGAAGDALKIALSVANTVPRMIGRYTAR